MVVMLVILGVVAALGVVCNGLILVSVIRYRILRKKHYTLLVSLAVCDMFKVVVITNVVISAILEDYKLCVANSSLGMSLLFVTTLHLAAESLNRCFIVRAPYKYNSVVKKKRLAICVALLWIVPFFVSIVLPGFWYKSDWFDSFQFQSHMFGCRETSNESNPMQHADAYIIMVHILFFAIPLIIMLVTYAIILKAAYESAKHLRETQVRKRTRKSPAVTETTYSNPIIAMVCSSYDTASISSTGKAIQPIQHKTRSQSVASTAKKELQRLIKNRKCEIKASKTVVMIVFAFIACNAPIFSITWLDISGVNSSNSEVSLRLILIGLAFLQVFIDPAVYFLRLKDYRNARKTIRRVGTTMIRKTIRRL